LTCCVKIGKVGSAKILPFGILPGTFLTICLHPFDILLCVLTYALVVAVGANNDVFSILEFCPRVMTAAAMARKETTTALLASVGTGRPVGGQATAWGIASHSVLGLTGVRTDDGVACSTSAR
jgi:hypothetical protein